MRKNDIKDCEQAADFNRYDAPAFVFECVFSSRAGSPVVESDSPQPPVQENKIDLFPTD